MVKKHINTLENNIMISKLETLKFKKLRQEHFDFYLPVIKRHFALPGKKIFGLQIDMEFLNNDINEICICGDYPPEYVYYLNNLAFHILKNCKKKIMNSYWIDFSQKKFYDSLLSTLLEFISDPLRWHNDNKSLCFVWGNIDSKVVFKTQNNFNGLFLPVLEGYGLIFILDEDNANYLLDLDLISNDFAVIGV